MWNNASHPLCSRSLTVFGASRPPQTVLAVSRHAWEITASESVSHWLAWPLSDSSVNFPEVFWQCISNMTCLAQQRLAVVICSKRCVITITCKNQVHNYNYKPLDKITRLCLSQKAGNHSDVSVYRSITETCGNTCKLNPVHGATKYNELLTRCSFRSLIL